MKSCRSEKPAPEEWRDIPGFGGRYQASSEGKLRRHWPVSGRYTQIKPYVRARRKGANSRALRVHLTLPDGRRVERTVLSLVAQTFFSAPAGLRPVHKNGARSDNSAGNIAFLAPHELGKRFGASAARRPVAKIDAEGNIVACYTSARAAARENYVSYQTVASRCNHRVKKEFALDGYSYRWDD